MLKKLLVFTFTGTLALCSGLVFASDTEQTQEKYQTKSQDQIYGSQLMTQQERSEYRERMRTAENAEDREKIRNEHHALMLERAKEQGVDLPESPRYMRHDMEHGGMGYGSGTGSMGSGSGMGGGKR